jgi:Alw26I/Eco31I/Esp3I family type II restriction m6 adenine DNA methyltransferase
MEQDIALDPELLGTIFENLIGFYNPETKENARKQTGSFYTPREIVDYMCSESLKESLKTRFPNLHTQIDRLIDRNEDYLNFPEKNKLLAAITDLKILDPACGSGAFPMGMFNLMVRTVEKLQEHKTTYKNKLDIIENCIYGIDIQNIAVEISKLRFFISLLVDYESPANIADFEVLPNLETKFVVANTLIGIDLGHSTDIFESQIIKEFQELTEIFLPFTTAKTPKEKEKINNDFNRKKEAIINNPNFEFGKDAKEKIRAWNPFNVCYCAPFFDSQIMFGITDGFDVVIGNPPYAQVPKGLFSKEQFPYSEGKDKGKQNLYKVFVEASYNLTNDKSGLVCLIVQSSLMCDLSSIFTRELLLRKTHVMQLIEFPKKSTDPSAQVFESVLQGTCVVLFKKIKLEDKHTIHLSINNNTRSINTPDFAIIPQSEFTELEAIGYPFPLFRRGEFDIWRKMRVKGQPLKSLITEVRQGDINLTNNSNAFSTSQTEVKLFRGRHVQRYHLKTEVEEYIKEGFFVQKANENKENTIIVCQEITGTVDPRRLIFTMVKDLPFHFVFGHTVQKFTLKNDEYSKVVLGILNSQLMDWFFRKTSTNNHIGGYEIEQLPMPDFNTNLENCTEITILVNQILSTKKENPAEDTSEFERKIDKLVYGLYGLTDEEIKIIEGGVK